MFWFESPAFRKSVDALVQTTSTNFDFKSATRFAAYQQTVRDRAHLRASEPCPLIEAKLAKGLESRAKATDVLLSRVLSVRKRVLAFAGPLEPESWRPMSFKSDAPLLLRLATCELVRQSHWDAFPGIHEPFLELMTLARSRGACVNGTDYLRVPLLFVAAKKMFVAAPVLTHLVDLGADVDAVPSVGPEGLVGLADKIGGAAAAAQMREAIQRQRNGVAPNTATAVAARPRRRAPL